MGGQDVTSTIVVACATAVHHRRSSVFSRRVTPASRLRRAIAPPSHHRAPIATLRQLDAAAPPLRYSACAGSSLSAVERRLHSRRASKAATKAARKSAPATGGVKKPHRCSAPHSTAAPRLIPLLLLTSAAASRCAALLICCKVPNPSNPSP
ncbi:hypothetical protein U1Q18_010989 [Sarracenia purpurea var. burkii]